MDSHNCLTLMNDIVHSTLKANLIGTELMGRISLLEKKARESEKFIHEAEEIAKGAQLEAANWKEQFENVQGTIEELQESRNNLEQQKRGLTSELVVAKASSSQFEKDKERLECSFSEQLSKCSEKIRELKALLAKKDEYAGELVQSLTQAQADLKISSDKVRALESSHASLEASFDFSLAENQSRNFDLNSELVKVLETIERTQQPLDFPSPTIEALVAEEPLNVEAVAVAVENAAILAPEGETSMTQFVDVEASVTLDPLIDPNTSSSAETAPVAASSEVSTVPVAASESEINIATSDVLTPSVTS
ncbi:uncharacterized protein C4H3.14c-like [Nicotiana sylvestris]|uniref:uncharacterized protein C4H3.14c-like n=1 Tax=Nicotiana sylvestris TaxID=4096 RepID=UPI00388CCDB6